MNQQKSKTPLHKKLGIKSDTEILVLNAPKSYLDFFADFPPNVLINEVENGAQFIFIHIFVKTNEELASFFKIAKDKLKKNGLLWISWPKKSSKIASELDKFVIMRYGLDNGLVDTKVASVDDNWSGHKFVYRVKDR